MRAYTIEALHFYEIRYSEEDRSMSVELDLRDKVPYIYMKAIRGWDSPHHGDTVTDAKKEEIIERIYEYLTVVKKYAEVEVNRS
jgi:hypothetical protein